MVIGLTAGALQVLSLAVINTQPSDRQRAKWMGIHISVAMLGTLLLLAVTLVLYAVYYRVTDVRRMMGA